jgi:hypothetical protein
MSEVIATAPSAFVKDIRGQVFTRWLVKSYAGTNKHKQSMWLCVCSCPDKREKVINIGALLNGRSKSCGCLYRETRRTSAMTHGGCYDPLYQCWNGMMQRCYNKNHESYPAYGGVGITVCERWHHYPNFKADMEPRPNTDYFSLDRFPNKAGNYEPGNVRWATRSEQQQNRKNNVLMTHNGVTQCQEAWTKQLGWHRSKIKNRRRAGWSVERILSTP